MLPVMYINIHYNMCEKRVEENRQHVGNIQIKVITFKEEQFIMLV